MKPHLGKKVGILIVEDDPEVVDYLSTTLRASGYDCYEAGSTAEALAGMKKCPADREPAIAIVDLILGSENGMETACALVAARPNLKILIISGYAETVVSSPLPNGCSAAFLTKPFSAKELRATLDVLETT